MMDVTINKESLTQVKAVLEVDLLPKYLAVFTTGTREQAEKEAEEKASAFIVDMSREINSKIVPMLYEDLGDNMELIDR